MLLNEETTKYVHNQIDENNERLLFSIYCDTAFNGVFYTELRESQNGKKGILYLLQEEPRLAENNFYMAFFKYLRKLKEDRQSFPDITEEFKNYNYRPYIKTIELEESEFENIMALLKNNPLPDVKGSGGGHDGCTIVFHSFVDCDSRYSYWVYPPKGYDHLRKITNIICEHLEEPYKNMFI